MERFHTTGATDSRRASKSALCQAGWRAVSSHTPSPDIHGREPWSRRYPNCVQGGIPRRRLELPCHVHALPFWKGFPRFALPARKLARLSRETPVRTGVTKKDSASRMKGTSRGIRPIEPRRVSPRRGGALTRRDRRQRPSRSGALLIAL